VIFKCGLENGVRREFGLRGGHEIPLILESAVEHRIRSAIGSCDGLRDGLGRVEEQPWRGFAHR
jgi:hypothetical protein